MKQVMKPLFVLFITALCLNSDATTSSSTQFRVGGLQVQESAKRLSLNSVAFAGTGQRLPS